MVFFTDRAWNFCMTVDRSVSEYAPIRPYWIEPRAGRNRDLTDEEIIAEIGQELGAKCIATINAYLREAAAQ